MAMNTREMSERARSLIDGGREAPWLEFKCNNADPTRIGEYVSAISNAAALHDQEEGFAIWGVEDVSGSITGTTFDPNTAKIGGQPLLMHLAQLLSPAIRLEVSECSIDARRILVMRVAAATTAPVAYKGERFIRIGESVTRLQGRPEERVLFAKLDKSPFEIRPAVARIDESEVLALLDYPSYFELLGLPLPADRTAILEHLASDRIVRRELEGWSILNFGALLLAKSLARFDALGAKAARAVVYRREDRTEIVRQRTGGEGYATGFRNLVSWINDQLPSTVRIGESIRAEVKTYPEVAVRELVANALIHQDMSISGTGPLIEIFPSRIEISNPGKPLIDPGRFLDLPPISRNERLAAIMRRMGMCEELGSGIDRSLSAIEVSQLPAPDFLVTESHTKVTLFPHRAFPAMNRDERVRAAYQHAGLMYITQRRMTNASLRARFGLVDDEYTKASAVIRDALAAGVLAHDDPTNKAPRHAKYVPFWAARPSPGSPKS
jgi:predicted HTH transcriptional regulator